MFKVLTRTASGMVDVWTETLEDGSMQPWRFETEAEAQKEIDYLVDELGHDPGDYEIVECEA